MSRMRNMENGAMSVGMTCVAADAAKKARASLGLDMQISTVETLRDGRLELDTTLHHAHR